ncbi:uncharacterized protein LOC143465247 [Clavelina lepadiformis]|uniref:uncharacterized protein LOC143465247 n=1 Tax=Clavelina lepadiformis TaxID=159417 RepID=UPI0040422918
MKRGSRGSREVYKWTLRQKALQDILAAYSMPRVDTLNLGNRLQLGQRGTNLLIDLIKSKNLKEVRFADCVMKQMDLQKLRRLLNDESESLFFDETFKFGFEGTVFLKNILQRKPVKKFSASNCGLSRLEIRNIIEALYYMEGDEILELNLQGNRIGEEGITLLRELLKRKTVYKLVLAHCYVTASQLQVLAGGITKMRGLMDGISLGGNLISKKDIEFFKKSVDKKVREIAQH